VGTGAVNTLAATAAGAGSGALIGAGLGLIGGPLAPLTSAVGAAVGAAIGGGIGLITGIVGSSVAGSSSAEEEEALNKIAEEYKNGRGAVLQNKTDEEYKQELVNLGISEGLAESLTQNRKAVDELCTEIAKNSDAVKALDK
jgi:hypothetical protein